jgi:two-component system, OmpR family, phosphate regulon sensor histidine kinase PhoR
LFGLDRNNSGGWLLHENAIKNRTLFLQFFGLQILVLLGAIGFVAGYTWFVTQEAFKRQWVKELESQAQVLASVLPDHQGEIQPAEVERVFKRVAGTGGYRFTCIRADGVVIADTDIDPRMLKTHADRPEIQEALKNGTGSQTRYSVSLGKNMLYFAQRIPMEGPARAVIRVAVPERTILHELAVSKRTMVALVILVFLAALTVSYWTSLRIIGPVSDIQKGVQQLGNGDFSFRLEIPPVPHLARLARSINQMAEQIERLSTIRQDFVANVSHELRTPVTAIKGFAETLLDGAKDSPKDCERFLGIILRQTTQLESIIHDLLELSRMEQNSIQSLDKFPTPLDEVIRNAVALCQSRADEKGVTLRISCEPGLIANIHVGFIEQALMNLIDNALKYGVTTEEPFIDISAKREGQSFAITVKDYGNGIPPGHLDRIFERFYRVDKGRSREMGGTGLGLSIVKHIALIHGGSVSVTSELGKGTAFTLTLPV